MNTELMFTLEHRMSHKAGKDVKRKIESSQSSVYVVPVATSLLGSLNAPDNPDYKTELKETLIQKYLP